MLNLRAFAAAGAAAIALAGPALALQSQTDNTFTKKVTTEYRLKYLLALPAGYARGSGKQWPVLLFLHGAGERGDDLSKVKTHGPPKLIAQGKALPFIVVSPQCPDQQWWEPQSLLALLDDIEKRYDVDTTREYVSGLSMGGFGTWAVAQAAPARFAAIAPICGGGMPIQARILIGSVPAWIFHGAKDPVVPVAYSQQMYDALKGAGDDVKLTIYPDAGHDSWTEAYNNPELFPWLLSHTRKAAPAGAR